MDDAALLKFDNEGVLIASQVAAGEENALKIRVYGEKVESNGFNMIQHSLTVRWLNEPAQILRVGSNYSQYLLLPIIAVLLADIQKVI
jgi:hypothetical protein